MKRPGFLRIVIIIILICLMLFNVSCNTAGTNKTELSDGKEPMLKVYTFINLYPFVFSTAVRRFNEISPKVKMEDVSFGLNGEEYKNKLRTEIMAGSGPDIIIVDSNIPVFNSIHKVMAGGTFCDLNELILKDKEFTLSDYNEKVLEAGVYNGKRYLIPTCYQYTVLFTFKQSIEEGKFNPNTLNWDLPSLAAFGSEFTEKNGSNGEYFFDERLMQGIIRSNLPSFIDYRTKTSKFDSPEFQKFIVTFKELLKGVSKIRKASYALLKDRNAIVADNKLVGAWFKIHDNYSQEIRVFTLPTMDGALKINAEPRFAVGINSKCKYPQEAFEYIKIVMSDSYQSGNYFNYPPVNRETYKRTANLYISNLEQKGYVESGEIFNKESAKIYTDSQAGKLESIFECSFIDEDIVRIFQEEVTRFIEGNSTSKDVARAIHAKVTLFLNE